MAHLGEFGRALADYEQGEPETFTFYGETFQIPARLSALVLMEMADTAKRCQDQADRAAVERAQAQARLAHAATDDERTEALTAIEAADRMSATAETEGTSAMHRFLQQVVGDQQWALFRYAAIKGGASQDELMEVAGFVFAAVSGRPTRRPSSSAGGPSSTGDGSTDTSASPEATPGPSRPVSGTVVPINPAAAQAAEFRASMVPVASLLASGD